MNESIWLWVGFNVFVLAMLALDLGVIVLILTVAIVASLLRPKKTTGVKPALKPVEASLPQTQP